MFNKRQTHEKMHRNFASDNDNDEQYEHDQFPEYERKHRTVTIPIHGGEMYGYFDEEDGDIVVINDENDGVENSESSTHWGVDVYHPKKGYRINPELFNGSRIRLRRGLFLL